MSLNDWVKLRETLAARTEAAGFPGLLPCAMGRDCRAYETADAHSKSGTPLHAADRTDVVEIREVLRRAGVRIALPGKPRNTVVCRVCTNWFHQREMWRDV
ncbi:hypothetical protein [Streptomyces sp. GESEQ-13]|uniref:hypothetical protein n=1 Tax=Streptomyces sp. GESEQ-13 TaxID=2812654 RepID=UPI001B340C76